MSITQLSWPVTGAAPNLENVFPSFKTLPVNFKRVDETIASLSSGTGGLVEMEFDNAFDVDLVAGNFIVWESDGYSLRSSRVEEIINVTTILINEVFTNADNANSFINYRKNYFLEARFLEKDTPTDEQTNVVLVLDEHSRVPNTLEGDILLDMSVVGDLITTSFDLSSGLIDNFFKEFKMQFRESYEGQRDLPWESPSQDDNIMVAISADTVPFNDFTDKDFAGLFFADSYPSFITYIRSDINDVDPSVQLLFTLQQFAIDKTLIQSDVIATFINVSGVIGVFVDPATIIEPTVFIKIGVSVAISTGQYDTGQYDPAEYA